MRVCVRLKESSADLGGEFGRRSADLRGDETSAEALPLARDSMGVGPAFGANRDTAEEGLHLRRAMVGVRGGCVEGVRARARAQARATVRARVITFGA